MAGTVTTTSSNAGPGDVIKKFTISWTSHTDGTATGNVDGFNGVIMRVVTNPGSAAPTDNWDVTLTDEDGLDLLAAQGTDQDTANSEQFCPGLAITDGTNTGVVPIAVNSSTLALSVSGAGSAKTGTIVIYYR
jgi:hypothetical protein